ncbi:MAG: hypothetical protein ABFS86_09105 [Planctomycetota bacterium]
MRRSAAPLTVALLLAACGADPDLSATEFAVRVLDPGTQPGREVVYTFPDDDWPTLHVVVLVDARWTAGDRVDQPAPRLRGRFPVDVRTRPRPDGGAVATVTVGEPARELAGCREFSGEIHWGPRGRVESFSLSVPDGTPPAAAALKGALLERLRRLLPPLPEGRVGVGARWKVVRPGPLVEVTTCRLVQLRRDRMRISFRIAGAAPEGGATMAGEGVMALTYASFYVTGEEKLTHTEARAVDDGEKHQRVTRVLRVRTSIAD